MNTDNENEGVISNHDTMSPTNMLPIEYPTKMEGSISSILDLFFSLYSLPSSASSILDNSSTLYGPCGFGFLILCS